MLSLGEARCLGPERILIIHEFVELKMKHAAELKACKWNCKLQGEGPATLQAFRKLGPRTQQRRKTSCGVWRDVVSLTV